MSADKGVAVAPTANVLVCCRFRPFNKVERESTAGQMGLVATFENPQTVSLQRSKEAEQEASMAAVNSAFKEEMSGDRVRFSFDRVFKDTDAQAEVFH